MLGILTSLLRRRRLINDEQPPAIGLPPDDFGADSWRCLACAVICPACVQHRQSFAGLNHGSSFQFHPASSRDKTLVGSADGLMSNHGLTTRDEDCARLIQSYQGLDISTIESVEEEGVDFGWVACGHGVNRPPRRLLPARNNRSREHPQEWEFPGPYTEAGRASNRYCDWPAVAGANRFRALRPCA